MGGSVRASRGDVGTIKIRVGQNRTIRRLRSEDRQGRFRKGFLSGDHGSAFQKRGLDYDRDDHRSAGTQIPVQRSSTAANLNWKWRMQRNGPSIRLKRKA